jgi:hypothetical protein
MSLHKSDQVNDAPQTKVRGVISHAYGTNSENKQTNGDLIAYIYNVIEDEWPFISSLADPSKRMSEIRNGEETTDCFFLSIAIETDFVFVSPLQISNEFQSYVKELLKYKNGEVIVPKSKTHLICDDLLMDNASLTTLIEKSKNYKRLVLISYSATEQFYKLKDMLIKLGVNVYTPETPEIESAWTVNFFGSKSGIRQLAQKSSALEPDFIMPDGIICVGKFDAAKIAANKYIKQKGVVIKTNKGSGGNGVLIFRENDLPNNYNECEKKIRSHLNGDLYWENYPIVVEDLINVNTSLSGGYPSIEFKIQKSGRIDMLYYCMMNVTPKGKFYGLDINDDLINERQLAAIIDTGYFIAEQYSTSGYRGHFDIDMIAAKNNKIYVTESNTRNSGGTDVYRVCQKLLGKEFDENYYVISRSKEPINFPENINFEWIYNKLRSILFDKKTNEGLIISSENNLKDKELIYYIVGRNKKNAYSLNNKLKMLLND